MILAKLAFGVWMSIIENIRWENAHELLKTLQKAGIVIDDKLKELMHSMKFPAEVNKPFDLVNIQLSQLGFDSPVSSDAIILRMMEMKLDAFLPAEVFLFRLKYRQPRDRSIFLFVKPDSTISKGTAFCLERNDDSKMTLEVVSPPLDHVWPLDATFILVLRS